MRTVLRVTHLYRIECDTDEVGRINFDVYNFDCRLLSRVLLFFNAIFISRVKGKITDFPPKIYDFWQFYLDFCKKQCKISDFAKIHVYLVMVFGFFRPCGIAGGKNPIWGFFSKTLFLPKVPN